MTTIRCSSLDRIIACPASLQAPDSVIIDEAGEPARIGSAVHEALACAIKCDPVDLDHIARVHGVEVKSFAHLYGAGKRVWGEIEAAIDLWPGAVEACYEMELMPGVTLTGHPDALGAQCAWVDDDKYADTPCLVIPDWKTGNKLQSYHYQQRGYAALAFDKYPDYNLA